VANDCGKGSPCVRRSASGSVRRSPLPPVAMVFDGSAPILELHAGDALPLERNTDCKHPPPLSPSLVGTGTGRGSRPNPTIIASKGTRRLELNPVVSSFPTHLHPRRPPATPPEPTCKRNNQHSDRATLCVGGGSQGKEGLGEV